MKDWLKQGRVVLVCSLAALGVSLPAAAFTHSSPPPPSHVTPEPAPSYHAHNIVPRSAWHGHHHGYGFYGWWPWYWPWTYGMPYYGTSFLVEAPVTYVEMAPSDSGAVQPATSWYYCKNPEGYFPYVKTCPSGWQEVPIQPPAAPATPPAPSVPPAPPPAS
ncbi:MAG: hypothetical protein JO002_03860 [Burkholderiaceae bacterium]|nr:hypothetical protein [Burkholderiaceae bacterium]